MELVTGNALIDICVSKSISGKSIRIQQMIIVRCIDFTASVHVIRFANRVCIDFSHRIDQLILEKI
jgi:hypothetical protein